MTITIETAKGGFSGTIHEIAAWQAKMQGAFAALRVVDAARGVDDTTGVDDIDFDVEDLGPAVMALRLVVAQAIAGSDDPSDADYAAADGGGQ